MSENNETFKSKVQSQVFGSVCEAYCIFILSLSLTTTIQQKCFYKTAVFLNSFSPASAQQSQQSLLVLRFRTDLTSRLAKHFL